ncbi:MULTISPECIES: argonaute PAZ domain-containing protein [Cyanophyceae]|uniref:argonaute PAZ domain-containing protein n=1 Tax=Cyanophyceae TaxID=3028117 RepID=UPI00016DC5C7|nr:MULTISPECIES: argonaute PAZ domain-containing protein [Cyanophyceae]ACA99020.1 conserved hypothetical protein containing Piwi domain [Picosynechococcus sp. PCC 7002]SMH35690.1 Piwi domain-containing protein [Picosynechococcus sp. OG1]SMQ84851.1 Piwi domain-containing protein [Synechococcus sp. 7002]
MICWQKTEADIRSDVSGWEIYRGFKLDIFVSSQGNVFLEVDEHYKLFSAWTLTQWLEWYPDFSAKILRNTYDGRTWKLQKITNEDPNNIDSGTGQTLATYHKNHQKPATDQEINSSKVIYVKPYNSKKEESYPHLSSRVKPCLFLDTLSELASQGDRKVKEVFNLIKPSIEDRFSRATEIAKQLAVEIYNIDEEISDDIKVVQVQAQQSSQDKSILLAHSSKRIDKVFKSLDQGCFRVGEIKFGCINLLDKNQDGWSKFILQKLQKLATIHNINIDANLVKAAVDIPEKDFEIDQFWESWVEQDIKTILVISEWLDNKYKTKLTRDALEHGITLQFMLPLKENVRRIESNKGVESKITCFTSDQYRANNILLGLLAKAGWQAVGLPLLNNEYAADLVIGFDAGRNETLSYGTSSFAVLADGQILGWELPEAQKGEILDPDHVRRTVRRIISQFQKMNGKQSPKRILLMRDGLIQQQEFSLITEALEEGEIKYDLISVRKSGAGRIGRRNSDGTYVDAPKGTVIFSGNDKFKIVTSEAKAGGSARPLFVVREQGDTPIEIIAEQFYRLTQLHPVSGSFTSRLPMPLNYADKLAKKIQSLGSVGILQNLDRKKLFFV